jgi:hypothetical protein
MWDMTKFFDAGRSRNCLDKLFVVYHITMHKCFQLMQGANGLLERVIG